MSPLHVKGIRGSVAVPAVQRFWANVGPPDVNGCRLWMASTTSRGYGKFRDDFKQTSAHRFVYELLVGPIPKGLTIDHLCRNRACVEVTHLEAVSAKENTLRSPNGVTAINARKTHCVHGHPFDEANTGFSRDARGVTRYCRACHRDADKRRRSR